MEMLVRSLARNESTISPNSTLIKDISDKVTSSDLKVSRNTVADYLDVLNKLHIIENLCERDLRIYAESIDAKLFHYRDNVTGLEVDSIIEIADGKYGAIEIKLGANQEEAVNNLKKFYNSVEVKPKFMCIICGLYNAVVKRPDGIYILQLQH